MSDSEETASESEQMSAEEESEEETRLSDEDEVSSFALKPSQLSTATKSNVSFKDIGVNNWLIKKLTEFGINQPTPVQAKCIPKVLEGLDVLGCAKTGTGKTLAFALPILQELLVDPYGIFALILTPTRELANQIADQFKSFGSHLNLKICTIIGGMDHVKQAIELTKKPHIVIATPGRLADQIASDATIAEVFQKIRFLVLDEGDQLLDALYGNELKTIFKALPKIRQTLLFSATITSALTQLHKVSIKKPFFFEDLDEIKTVENLEQRYVLCPKSVKDAYLVYVVKSYYENKKDGSVLIFAETCKECQALAMMFKELGFRAGSLHSVISQKERNKSLTLFRSKQIRILICTDVAARGLDIPHVELVVNHNVPNEPKTYVHRVGRSARAGRFGSSITFITQHDIQLVREIEALTGKQLEKLAVSNKNVTKHVTKVLMLKKKAELKLEKQKFGEKREINQRKNMMMTGMTEEEAEVELKKNKKRRFQKMNQAHGQGKTKKMKV